MRIALKIGYDGRAFHGFARQPDVRTVEGEVAFALEKAGIIAGREAARLQGASRTDAGVSALGNVVALDADTGPEAIVGRFNDAARDVWAWATAGVPDGLDPRRARQRWYRYHLTEGHDVTALREGALAFVGTHDFASFASPDARRTRRHVDAIDVAAAGDGVIVDVRAPSFLRGMVRRIVAALVAMERGVVSGDDIRAALAGPRRDFGTVPAEPLTLVDVDIGVPFRPAADRACRARIAAKSADHAVAARFWADAARRVGGLAGAEAPSEDALPP